MMSDAEKGRTIVAVATAFEGVRNGGEAHCCARCSLMFPALTESGKCALCRLGAWFATATLDDLARFTWMGTLC
ncbi:MAG: hypothetical protein JWM87_713 [Candidatus Eremiobacteraeota bacterium]|nr:hypothetical protein [Candidatus Eremiobacteraeota bacterium]